MKMKNVAILGLGAMGSRMASNFLKEGYSLNIWNRTADSCKPLVEEGAKQFSTPKDAVSNADIVISMLTNDEASREVWLASETGAIAGLKKNAIAIESSTLSLDWSLELASKVEQAGAEFLDASVVGSRPQAEAAQLMYLVGGNTSTLEKANAALQVNSSAIHHLGEVGTGISMKLSVNGLFGIQVAALSEILGLLKESGIDKETAISVLNELPTTSLALKGIGMAISADNFSPLFPINLVEKDFSYLEKLAESKSSAIPVVKTTTRLYQKAQVAGYGQDNIAGVAQLYL